MRLILAVVIAASTGIAAAPAETATGQIDCGMRGPQICKVFTGNYVKLLRATRPNACVEGKTWSFTLYTIKVESGCAGTFAFGKQRTPGVLSIEDTALASELQKLLTSPTAPLTGQQPASNAARPPAWATGSFSGFDASVGQQVLLNIQRDGFVLLRDRDGKALNTGTLHVGFIEWQDGQKSPLFQEKPGLSLGLDQSNREFRFR